MTDYKAIKYNVSGADLTGLTAGQIPNLAASKITSGELANARVADLPTSKVTSGTFADARISSGSVTQHVTAFDDTDLRSDIMTLALKEAITENRVAYNLPNAMIEQFQDDSKIGTETDGDRNSSEYWATVANDSQTVFLMHGDDTSLIDSSDSGHTTTLVGSAGRSSSLSKFGGYSAWADGNDDVIYWGANSSDFSFGTGDWTLDWWFYVPNGFEASGDTYIGPSSIQWGTSNGFRCNASPVDGNYRLSCSTEYDTGYVLLTGTTNLSLGQWYHGAFVRNGTTQSIYLNGTSEDSETIDAGAVHLQGNDHANRVVTLFARQNSATSLSFDQFSNVYADEVRISKGIARWTSNFTPETSAYSNATANATGTLISTAQTANAAQTKVSGVILYKNEEGTATLGTDLKIYFTCDGGSNWTESTPTAAGTFSSGILMAKCPEVTCTSGTDIRYKAVWANQLSGSKETQLHGIGMNY